MSYSAIDVVDSMLREAIERRASDIHLESTPRGLEVRYRIDGVLYHQQPIVTGYMQAILARLKILSHIDIAERRLPHDGKFAFLYGSLEVDCRVSTLPSLYGEKMVVRILNRASVMLDLEALGFQESMKKEFQALISRAQGFFLVTGPTGSGKTTTLYAALNALKAPEKNVVTLEDPIEYAVDGVTQSAVHPDIGYTFASGIRAMMRQDPDVIMVGEIRDFITAQTAIQAALTGHLVLSTVHTNDAVSTVMRLVDMGVDSSLINAALTGVLAQRLARKICQSCRMPYDPSEQEREFIKQKGLQIDLTYKGVGCTSCAGLGYKGRVGLFELLILSRQFKLLMRNNANYEQLYGQACQDGMRAIMLDAVSKVHGGLISLHELMRVLC